MIRPRIEYEEADALRLEPEPVAELPAVAERRGAAVLVLGGVVVLVIGFSLLSAGNFIADQFARASWLGWLTAGVASAGFGLVGAGVWREVRGLFALGHVDHLRADLASGDGVRIMRAARAWSAQVDRGTDTAPALAAINDPDAALALLRARPSRALREAADALSRGAAVQVVGGIAAVPSPSLDILFVAWRGVRLIREVAMLYGVRPGLLGTLALLRRTALSATMVGVAEFAGNTVAHAVLSSPWLAKTLGEAAGAGVAARRMLVLGRAVAMACDPVPPAR